MINLLAPSSKFDDYETLSFSSHESQKMSIPLSSMQGHNISIGLNNVNVNKNVAKQLQKNQAKYKKILVENPYYNMELYRPKLQNARNGHFNGELLGKQLDRLMEDECILDMQLSKMHLISIQQQQNKLFQLDTNMSHYKFLHTVWQKPSPPSCLDKLDTLSHKVATIKNHIKKLTSKQSQQNQNQSSFNFNSNLDQFVLQSKQYVDLKMQYERNLVESQRKDREIRDMGEKIRELEDQIGRVGAANCVLVKKIGEDGDRSKRKQEEMLKILQKNQTLELQLLKKDKQIIKLSKQYPHNMSKSPSQLKSSFEQISNPTSPAKCSLSAPNPETPTKNLKFLNKSHSLIVTIESNNLQSDMGAAMTTRTLSQIKTFLMNINTLQTLMQPKFLTSPITPFSIPSIPSNLLSNLVSERPVSRRKNPIYDRQKNDVKNRQYGLGSVDKRKRFQRTRNLEMLAEIRTGTTGVSSGNV